MTCLPTKLEEIIKIYNQENNAKGGRAYLQRYEQQSESNWDKPSNKCSTQPLVLAICTPLMYRAHLQSGELVHCDSTASLDRYNSPTFIVVQLEGYVVVTSGEDEETISEAFTHLKNVLPNGAFYGSFL